MWPLYIIVACVFYITGVVTGVMIADDSDEHDDYD